MPTPKDARKIGTAELCSTTDDLKTWFAKALEKALRDHPPISIVPRRLTEAQSAKYLGRSKFWLRNLRKADEYRVSEGGERFGPQPVFENRTPFYLRETLDRWIDKGGLGHRADALVIPCYKKPKRGRCDE